MATRTLKEFSYHVLQLVSTKAEGWAYNPFKHCANYSFLVPIKFYGQTLKKSLSKMELCLPEEKLLSLIKAVGCSMYKEGVTLANRAPAICKKFCFPAAQTYIIWTRNAKVQVYTS